MEKTFKIKNLTYTQSEIRKISINDLKIGKICPGYIIYFFKSKPDPVIFVQAGDPITKEIIQRLEKKKLKTLDICEVYNRDRKDRLVKLLNELKVLKFEEERAFHAQEIIKEVLDCSFYEKEGNLLELIISFQEVFYSFPEDLTESFFDMSTEDYVRNSEVAFFASFMTLVMGYYDFKWVQDIYNLSFILDISLMQDFSYHMRLAKELEIQKAKSGIDLLNNISPDEVSKFEIHPEQSFEFAKNIGNVFHTKNLLENIKNQHERADGSGFDNKKQNELFDWEILLSFTDIFIGKRNPHFYKKDASKKYTNRMRDIRLTEGFRKKHYVRFFDYLQKYVDYYSEKNEVEEIA